MLRAPAVFALPCAATMPAGAQQPAFSGADGAADRDKDGWTNLEEYLNGLAAAPKGIA